MIEKLEKFFNKKKFNSIYKIKIIISLKEKQ